MSSTHLIQATFHLFIYIGLLDDIFDWVIGSQNPRYEDQGSDITLFLTFFFCSAM